MPTTPTAGQHLDERRQWNDQPARDTRLPLAEAWEEAQRGCLHCGARGHTADEVAALFADL